MIGIVLAGMASAVGVVAAGEARRALGSRRIRSRLAGSGGRRSESLVTLVARSLESLRARRSSEAALADVVDAVAGGLRTGLSPRQALAAAVEAAPAALGDDVGRVVAQIEAGVPVATALDGWAARSSSRSVDLAVAALALGVRTGGAHARALSGVAGTIRDRVALRAEARAMAAQARLSTLVITVAPVAFLAFLAVTDPRITAFMFGTPIGWAVLAAGLGLDLVAGLWMARLSRIDV